MNTSVKFIFCDIGGVLFDEAGTNYMAKDLGVPPDRFRKARIKYLISSLIGKITVDELISNTLRDLNIDLKVENYNDYWASHSKPYPAAHQMLSTIAESYPVGLLTNNVKGSLPYYKKHGLFPDLKYQHVIESSKIGFKKPDKKIYDFAQKKVGIDPEAILIIDDRQNNLDTAKKLGWKTMLFDKKNQEASIRQILSYLKLK